MHTLRHYPHGIHALDAGYVRPQLAAIHLIVDDGRVALIDTGSNDSSPQVHAALAALGLSVEAVDYIVLTHVHLDHAGGAGRLMRECPNARLVVHSRGARHMIEPSALVAGVTAVYGESYVARVYGEILPVDAARVIEARDGTVITLGKRELLLLDTPGHARHHICIFDKTARGAFTGDTFGLSYREFDVEGRPFIFPTTTPTQFDPTDMRNSIKRVLALQPDALYLTHYAQVTGVPMLAVSMFKHLDRYVDICEQRASAGSHRERLIREDLQAYLLSSLRAHGVAMSDDDILAVIGMDIELNAQGMDIWLASRK